MALYYHDSAIVYYTYNNRLNGSIINVFEYFFCAYEKNPDIKLIFINGQKEYLDHFIRTVEDRYDLSGLEGYKDNVLMIPKTQLLRTKFGRALVTDYGTIPQIRGLLCAKDLMVITEIKPDQKDFILTRDTYNVTYYGEMPFHYKHEDYRMKMLLNRLKPLKKVKSAIFINSPHNWDFSFVEGLNLPDKPWFHKTRTHQDNLFEMFDTYVYYHADKWFDPHPRLFVECAYYDKEIIYFNPKNIIDGSYYRYHDVLENGYKDRQLTENDEIIERLI